MSGAPGTPALGTAPEVAPSTAGTPAATGDRPSLADRQAALVAALVEGAPDPAGVDPVRLDATRKALLRKRSGEAARYWPLLAAGLGRDWTAFAAEVLAGRPVAGGLRDGWDVARAARARGLLTPGAARELAERERALRYDGASPPRPRLRTRLRTLGRR